MATLHASASRAAVVTARSAVAVFVLAAAWACDEGPTSPSESGLSLSCPGTITVSTAAAQTAVTYTLPTASGGRAPVAVACSPPPGSTFPVGSTPVDCTATDSSNRTGSCRTTVTVTRITSLGGTRFLAFGDSITAGEVTSPVSAAGQSQFLPLIVVPESSYPAQLLRRLQARYATQASEIAVVNAGRSGELAANGIPRLAQLLANSQTEALLLLHGYNDLLDFGAGAVSPASAALNEMARQGRLRGARVFIGLLPPPIAGRQRSVPVDVVQAFNDRLRIIAAGEGAVLVDVYGALAADVARYIGVDGLHPTEAGYQRIADEFLSEIGTHLAAR